MKKNPKTPSLSINTLSDRKLACAALALCLMGGTALTAQASGNRGGQTSDTQQVATTSRITGTVLDENGDPMIGVSVIEEGTKTGVATDLDGNFSLNVRPGAVLHFSYIGYKSQSIKVGKTNSIEVTMQPDDNVLDDVVVVGFGTVKKRDLTGAISSVKSDVITLTPASNPMAALQGRVSGLDITQTSGQPGEGLNIQLRGNRSISASGTPLFIIDGMPGDYATINPNDIESIEVLKDASSTAVYGSEGSNGVIIITTKKGQEGKMRVNFEAYMGVNGWSTTPKMNSPEENIRTRELAQKYSGSVQDDSVLEAYKAALAAGQTIDWVDELLGTGITQNYSLSMSGGTEKTQAYFSLNYNDENGQYKNDSYKVYSTSIRLNTKLNNWLSGGVHVQASYSNRNTTTCRLDRGLMADPFGTLYDENGNLNPLPLVANSNLVNLLLNRDQDAYRNNPTNLRLYVQPYIKISPIKGLTLESRMSGNFNYSTRPKYIGYNSYEYFVNAGTGAENPDFYDPSLTNAEIKNSRTWGYTWENILTYNFKLADIHEFTITGVTSWSSSQTDDSSLYNSGIPSNTMYWTNMGTATGTPTISSAYSMHKRMGYVGRINYNLMGKYLFSASIRRDGDSRFAADGHWYTFPAASVGWRISDEEFMESTRTWMNNLKLRVGYGETGGAGINPYDSWSILTTGKLGLGDQVVEISKFPQILSNAALTWERSKSWNFGLDFGVLNNRIDVAAEYYITNTSAVIWKQEVPIINGGFDSKTPFVINRNIASTRNQGFELTVNTHNIDTRDFTWTSTLTFSTNKEKVTSLGAGAADYIDNGDYCLHVGDPVNSYRSYDFGGIWQLGEEADAAAFGLRPGDLRIKVPGMRKISDGVWEKTYSDGSTKEFTANDPYTYNADDRVIIGHNSPDWTLGFQNTFSYKWFDLSIYMYWRNGQKFKYDPMGWYKDGGGSFPEHFNYWTPENPSNDFPALDSSRDWQKLPGHEARYWVDGSFFKIKNITLGYTLPALACSKIGISHFRLYGTITNPLVHANSKFLKGYDPEMNGSFNFPLTRQLVFGLNVSF
ncbi:TonB-dependent receptor [uncultured Duncaniella sp.]|uniref:SusC/RagA family TonB-linked outer membrane protein n=1 Tax=uncultured Duncaniella sp. TaxID=2768039 RepID=UPI0025DE987B|nr:TonB-dependent receptor [uncultured Duncaniella sp.]